jgi:hypothetical protein
MELSMKLNLILLFSFTLFSINYSIADTGSNVQDSCSNNPSISERVHRAYQNTTQISCVKCHASDFNNANVDSLGANAAHSGIYVSGQGPSSMDCSACHRNFFTFKAVHP